MFTQRRSVASQVMLVLGTSVALVVVLSLLFGWWGATRQVQDAAATRVADIAQTVAASDAVRTGLAASDPSATLQPYAERVRLATQTEFVVVMSPTGTRYSHPNPELIGQQFRGTIADAAAGGRVIEQYTGSLGPSTRAVVPVLIDGEVRGLVAVGIHQDQVAHQVQAMLPQVLGPGLAAALLGSLGAWLVARQVRRDTLGLNASELRAMHDHHDAVLHAIREGLLITDARGRVQVLNDEARRLLRLPEASGEGADPVLGRPLEELDLPADLVATVRDPGRHVDEPHAAGGRVLLVSSAEIRNRGRAAGTLTTLRDRTDLEVLTGQLNATQSLADALHAQAHESANQLHSVITLIELGRPDEAVHFATDVLRTSQEHRDAIAEAVEEPAVAALLLGKASLASERGVRFALDPDAHLPRGLVPPREVVTILGNLVDNALDAVAGTPDAEVTVDLGLATDRVLLTVSDNGPGLSEEARQHAFERGWTTKPSDSPAGRGLGLSLVRQVVAHLDGTIEVGPGPGASFVVAIPLRRGR